MIDIFENSLLLCYCFWTDNLGRLLEGHLVARSIKQETVSLLARSDLHCFSIAGQDSAEGGGDSAP